MTWQGEKLKDIIQNNGLTFKEIAKKTQAQYLLIKGWAK